jgi:hypothetical protein
MANKPRTGLSYFPLDVHIFSDIKVRKLMRQQGSDAISVYVCLLASIYRDGYYVRVDKDLPFIISELTGYKEVYILEVIKSCLSVELFSSDLYERESILTSRGIQRRYAEISALMRHKVQVTKYSLLDEEDSDEAAELDVKKLTDSALLYNNEPAGGIDAATIAINAALMDENVTLLPQRKGKEIKEKERETAAVAASPPSSEIYKTSGKAVKGTGKPLAEREADFRKAVDAFAGEYEKDMLETFKDCYTAHTPDALRMKFEKDKFFDIERKLREWGRREKKFYPSSKRRQAQETDEEAMRKRKQDEEYKKQKAREQAARDAQKKKEWEEQLAEAGITPEMTEGMSVFERMNFIQKRLEEFEQKKE